MPRHISTKVKEQLRGLEDVYVRPSSCSDDYEIVHEPSGEVLHKISGMAVEAARSRILLSNKEKEKIRKTLAHILGNDKEKSEINITPKSFRQRQEDRKKKAPWGNG